MKLKTWLLVLMLVQGGVSTAAESAQPKVYRAYTDKQREVIAYFAEYRRRTNYVCSDVAQIENAVIKNDIHPDDILVSDGHYAVVLEAALRADNVQLIARLVSVKPGIVDSSGISMSIVGAIRSKAAAHVMFHSASIRQELRESLLFNTEALLRDPSLALAFCKAGAYPPGIDELGNTALTHVLGNYHRDSGRGHRIVALERLVRYLVGLGVPTERPGGFEGNFKAWQECARKRIGESLAKFDSVYVQDAQKVTIAIENACVERDNAWRARAGGLEQILTPLVFQGPRDLIIGYSQEACLPAAIKAELAALDGEQELKKALASPVGPGNAAEPAGCPCVVS